MRKVIDFEELGFQTMLETQDERIATNICGLQISAYADQIQPEIAHLGFSVQTTRSRTDALCSHLYDRPIPASDAAMLGRRIAVGILIVLFLIAFVAATAGHVTTFHLFGLGSVLSVILGMTLTGIVTATGHQAYEKILVAHKVLQAVVIITAFTLCFWGLLQLAQARGVMVDKAVTTSPSQSYVDDPSAEISASALPNTNDSVEQKVRQVAGSAIVKIMLSADLIIGILLGLIVLVYTDPDYAAWHQLKKMVEFLGRLEKERKELLSRIEIAKKNCMAGILRAKNLQTKKHIPYHQLVPLILLTLLVPGASLFGQTISHQEGILLDVSGSIGSGSSNELFREYLLGIKRLLLTEPPNSRVWVCVITTDSFGSVRGLLKGWTPSAQGVFTDNLTRSRRELAGSFESKAAGLSPVYAGTDIIGGLWHLKTLLESGSLDGQPRSIAREIFIFSDMLNETSDLPMPKQLVLGPVNMLEYTKANGLIVPLPGYRIHVLGAAQKGLTPQMWTAVREFWTLYFRESGARLVSYSSDILSGDEIRQ